MKMFASLADLGLWRMQLRWRRQIPIAQWTKVSIVARCRIFISSLTIVLLSFCVCLLLFVVCVALSCIDDEWKLKKWLQTTVMHGYATKSQFEEKHVMKLNISWLLVKTSATEWGLQIPYRWVGGWRWRGQKTFHSKTIVTLLLVILDHIILITTPSTVIIIRPSIIITLVNIITIVSRLPCYVFCICLLTYKYQKYKSVELGDQLHHRHHQHDWDDWRVSWIVQVQDAVHDHWSGCPEKCCLSKYFCWDTL